MNIGQHTTAGDGHTAEQFVELLVVADGELHVSGDNTASLVVTSGVTGELENLSSEVLEDSGEVYRGGTSHTSRVATFPKETRDTTDGELKSGTGRSRGGLATLLASASFTFTFSSHNIVETLNNNAKYTSSIFLSMGSLTILWLILFFFVILSILL